MFDLSGFRLQDMTAGCAALRRLGTGASSIEAAADRITQYLYTNLTTGPDEDPACVLVRLFKTHPYHRLSPELQTLVDTHLGSKPADPGMKCLTLLGSTGVASGWNDPSRSSRFRVIPLAGPEALAKLPMFSQLFAQFHSDRPFLNTPTPPLLLDQHATTFNVFHVPEARNSHHGPWQQEFVVPFGVQSVLGFGGQLSTGELFAVTLFTNIAVPSETAELFKPFALSAKLILAPFEHERLILPTSQPAPRPGGTEKADTLASLQDRVATLESILAVQEQAVQQQSSRLEASLADSLRHAENLQAQSLRFETLSATSPVGIFQTDADDQCLYTNSAWQEIAGRSLADCLGNGWRQAVAEEDRAEVLCQWQETVRQGRDCDVEFRIRRPDGTIRWVHSRAHPLRNDRGETVGHVGTMEDITDRKAAEVQFKQVFESSYVGMLMVADDGRITLANPRIEQTFGYRRDELIGQPVEILLPERFRTTHHSQRISFMASGASRPMAEGRELHGCRKDGGEFPVEIGLTPVDTPQGRQVLASITDITERKQNDAARFRLQQAIEYAQDGMALLDDTGQYIYMNRAHASIFGYTVDDLLGKSWTSLYPAEWAAMIEQMYLPILHSAGQWQGEVVGKQKSGNAFHIDLSLTLLEDPGTGRRTILCTCRDITHRKQMERDLIDAKDAAEAGIRAKSEFLATMSHEIRTPMNGVLGMTGLLFDTTLTPEQREFVQTLKHSGESLMKIINDILDYSKIEAGKLTIESIPFDLRMTVEDILDLLAPTAQSKHLELVGLIDAQAPNAMVGDPGRIRQILTNLIGNAIKFTERGEVLVQVTKTEEDGASILLRFEIVDTGVGLTEEATAKLFQSFTQADSSTARKYGGTGLGLAICKRLTELMGGQIGLQSSPGTGTCVWFTLRLCKQPPAATPTPPPILIDSLSGLRICLVDDNATNRSLLQYHACDWKMHYESAEDGPSALSLIRRAAAEKKPFDLAILDMQMPGMNGLQLGQAIRADARLDHTRLVLLTSLGRRGDAKAAHSAGFSGYLTKPVRKTNLYDCLRLVMGQSPVSQADEQATLAAPALITRHQVAEVHAQRRLLVVDDNLVNQKVAVKMLEKLGLRVDVAGNGKEALLALTRHPYHLVFMDCQMPEMDGFETTRYIRSHERPGCHLSIIAMTANATADDREHCLASGMDDFVSKPVKSQDLHRVLTQWLNPSDNRAAA